MNINYKTIFPDYLKFLFFIYLIGLLFFFGARITLLALHLDQISQFKFTDMLLAFWMGFRFDTVVSGYLLIFPFILMLIGALIFKAKKFFYNFAFVILLIEYVVLLFILASDLPYFNHYNSRITIAALTWSDSPDFVLKMIAQDKTYYIYILIFIVISIALVYSFVKIKRRFFLKDLYTIPANKLKYYIKVSLTGIFALVVILVAIRGRLDYKSPIRWGTAFFSTNPFLNQMGLNPGFTFFQSYLDSQNASNESLHLIEDTKALEIMKQEYGTTNSSYPSPIARLIKSGSPNQKNVVLVLMESMAAWKMNSFGSTKNLTPFLDSLANVSYLFTNFYSSGIHTFCGIYSSFFGLPVLLSHHPMKTVESMQGFTGIAKVLTQINYQTIFFTTHDAQFDNMGGFLSNNGFQTVVSQKDYPAEKVQSTLGVPDGDLFEAMIPYLNNLASNNKPFFAAVLTASDHGPYIIPKVAGFSPKSSDEQSQIVEYADWSIKHFIDLVKNEPWFNNTIFVFTADHGAINRPIYDLDLSFTHTPLIIYYNGMNPSRISNLGGQVDLNATILSLLNVNYINNTFGKNIIDNSRRYVCFNADDDMGCIDDEFYYIKLSNGTEHLYRYKEREIADVLHQYPAKALSMREYVMSYFQTAQWMISNKKAYDLNLKAN